MHALVAVRIHWAPPPNKNHSNAATAPYKTRMLKKVSFQWSWAVASRFFCVGQGLSCKKKKKKNYSYLSRGELLMEMKTTRQNCETNFQTFISAKVTKIIVNSSGILVAFCISDTLRNILKGLSVKSHLLQLVRSPIAHCSGWLLKCFFTTQDRSKTEDWLCCDRIYSYSIEYWNYAKHTKQLSSTDYTNTGVIISMQCCSTRIPLKDSIFIEHYEFKLFKICRKLKRYYLSQSRVIMYYYGFIGSNDITRISVKLWSAQSHNYIQ